MKKRVKRNKRGNFVFIVLAAVAILLTGSLFYMYNNITGFGIYEEIYNQTFEPEYNTSEEETLILSDFENMTETIPENDTSEDQDLIIEPQDTDIENQNTSLEDENTTLTPNNTEEITKIIEENPAEKTEITTQYEAEIGKPVKWVKKVRLENKRKNTQVNIPSNTLNFKVEKIENGIKQDITDKVDLGEGNTARTLQTSTTNDETIEFNITDEISELEIEYYTEPPQTIEEEITPYKKQIIVYSDTHYENISTYTNITESLRDSIKLYRITDNSREQVNDIEYKDTNNNQLIDQIRWTTPHLSNETYEVEIIILNIQSYPLVGGEWTVMFNTTGTADLKITATNGTTWQNDSEDQDLKLLEIKCGEETKEYEWVINEDGSRSAYLQNYSCETTNYERSKVLTKGAHTLRFEFGSLETYAYNYASGECVGVEPPANEATAWVVNESTSCTDTIISRRNTNVIIEPGAQLVFENVTLIMNASGDGDYDINNSGTFIVNYSNITNGDTGAANYRFYASEGSTLEIYNSEINKVGWTTGGTPIVNSRSGIWIGTTNAILQNNNITSDYRGIICWSCNNTLIEGNNIQTADIAVHFIEHAYENTVANNTLYAIGAAYSLYIQNNTDNNIIDGNNIQSNYSFVVTDECDNNTFNSNDFQSWVGYGGYIQINVTNNTFSWNNFTSLPSYGFYMSANASFNTFTNNIFESGSSDDYALYMYNDNDDNYFYANSFNASGSTLYVSLDNDNNTFEENNITATTASRYGMYVASYSHNSQIINNTIDSDIYIGLRVDTSNYTLVENNTASSRTSYGFYFASYNYNATVYNNMFSGYYPMYQYFSNDSLFLENNFDSQTGYTYISVNGYNNYTNNNFTSNSSYGLYFYPRNLYNLFEGNTFTSTSSYGAYIQLGNIRNTFMWNNFSSNSSFGVRFNNNNDENVFLYNNATSFRSYAFYFDDRNDHNIFEYNDFTATEGWGGYIVTNCNNNTFNNVNFISGNETNNDALYMVNNPGGNTIENSTMVGERYGLYIQNSENNTIQYNVINSTTNVYGDGLTVYLTSNNNLINENIIEANRFPMYMTSGSQYNNITYNNFSAPNNSYLYISTAADYNVISHNSIVTNSTDGPPGLYVVLSTGNQITENEIYSGDHGVYLYSASENVVDNNNITVARIVGSYGVYLYLLSDLNNITNNNITSYGGIGLRIYASLNNLVQNNQMEYAGSTGIYIDEGSEGNQILSNYIYNSTGDGIYLLSSNDNVIKFNNITLNQNGISTINSLSNQIEGNEIYDSRGIGLSLGDATTGTSIFENGDFLDNIINGSGTRDVNLVSSTLTAINLTFDGNPSVDSTSSATFNYWVDINVSDTIAQVPNATVEIYDNTETFIDNATTDAEGYISKFNLTEYTKVGTVLTYYSNYTFNASAINYFDSTNSDNISSNFVMNITLMESVAPQLVEIILTPNDEDGVDPDVEINITSNMTDYTGIDTVWLQYKFSDDEDWTNSSMVYATGSGLYENGLFTPNANGTWEYRIWANDTYDNAGYSTNYSLDVQYDSTWNMTPSDLGTVIGILNTIGNLGTLTINNTGDFNMTIDLSSTWAGTTYNITTPFLIQPKETISFLTSVTFDDSITDIYSNITANASSEDQTPNPLELNSSVLISSYTGGPYLELTLDTYPSVTAQTSLEILNAKVQNLAKYDNETVHNITVNWTLPTGWSILTGNITTNISNLTAQEIDYVNLTVMISTSAPYDINSTNTTIIVSANSDSDTYDETSANVSLLCNDADGVCGNGCWQEVDIDCKGVVYISPGGGGAAGGSSGGSGGGGGGNIVTEERALILEQSAQTVEILRGQSNKFDLEIKNIYPDSTLNDVTLDIGGYLKQYVKIEPPNIPKIDYKDKNKFTVVIEAPQYLTFGVYQLEATISGKLVKDGASQTITGRRQITLIVHEITQEAASELISLGEKTLLEMKNEGFPTALIARMLDEAKTAYENKEYQKIKNIIDAMLQKKEQAHEAKGLIKSIEERINNAEKQGLDASSTKKLLDIALTSFEREDYTTAIQNLKQAQLVELLETKGRVNIIRFVINYWWGVLGAIILLNIAGIMTYRKINLLIIDYRILYINKEEKNIISLIKEIQKEYYVKKSLDNNKFSTALEQYNRRLTSIRQTRLGLMAKKSADLSPNQMLINLKKEREDITKMLKSAQEKYFVKKTMSLAGYNTELGLNQERLTEIDKNIELIKYKLSQQNSPFQKFKNSLLNIFQRIYSLKIIKPKEKGIKVRKNRR